MKQLKHHHLIYQANTGDRCKNYSKKDLKIFLENLIEEINMTCLIPVRVKLSHQNAWTGLVGIVTSHISFHYFIDLNELQLDIYSCKEFDIDKTIKILNNYWNSKNYSALFINRKLGERFKIKKIQNKR